MQALQSYQAILVTPSPFDKLLEGERSAPSQRQLAGLQVFLDLSCSDGHDGPLFRADPAALQVPHGIVPGIEGRLRGAAVEGDDATVGYGDRARVGGGAADTVRVRAMWGWSGVWSGGAADP